jgi:hypothetical protein
MKFLQRAMDDAPQCLRIEGKLAMHDAPCNSDGQLQEFGFGLCTNAPLGGCQIRNGGGHTLHYGANLRSGFFARLLGALSESFLPRA